MALALADPFSEGVLPPTVYMLGVHYDVSPPKPPPDAPAA
eukprot:CAMPEP_0173440064 /NCGR_PEP_ID=MMETSP1357-20121228/22185_1 /TAXON_ID=77926 /ORGANISM="Hemiselmis rufescens, Strain PCC563" /LENGTH=39 /DNA_ID= /DNA_START= /DNA_END= /DNA_ORIENTATION=